MALQAGIVGLPNVGKSTLFNAVSNSAKAQASNYRFCTIDPNIGLVDVPDERLKKLAELVQPNRIVPTQIEIVDRSEEHTSELQSRLHLVCRLLLEKKKK